MFMMSQPDNYYLIHYIDPDHSTDAAEMTGKTDAGSNRLVEML